MAAGTDIEVRVTRRRSRFARWMVALACTAYLGVQTAGVNAAYALVPLVFVAIWYALPWRTGAGLLGASAAGLAFKGKPLAAWPRITAVVPAGERGLVVQWRGCPGPRAETFELAEANAAARVAGLAALHVRRTRIEAGVRILDVGFVLVFAAVVAVGAFAHAWGLAASVLLLALGYVRATIVIGADGIALPPLSRRRFVRADEISDCTVVGAARLRVDLVGGGSVKVGLPADATESREQQLASDYAHAIAACIRAIRRPGPALSGAQRGALQRGSRTPADWLAALRGAAPAPHRGALPRELLWQIAESPGADEERVAALAALAPSIDRAERARVEALSAETGSPRVRAAITAVLASDDAAVVRALAAAVPRRTDNP